MFCGRERGRVDWKGCVREPSQERSDEGCFDLMSGIRQASCGSDSSATTAFVKSSSLRRLSLHFMALASHPRKDQDRIDCASMS